MATDALAPCFAGSSANMYMINGSLSSTRKDFHHLHYYTLRNDVNIFLCFVKSIHFNMSQCTLPRGCSNHPLQFGSNTWQACWAIELHTSRSATNRRRTCCVLHVSKGTDVEFHILVFSILTKHKPDVSNYVFATLFARRLKLSPFG